MQDEIQWCECACQRCKRILRFKPLQAGNRVDCPFCKSNTLLQYEESKTHVSLLDNLKRLGGWGPIILVSIALLAIGGFGAYKLASQINPVLGGFEPMLYTVIFINTVAFLVSVIFFIFLIKWMLDVRRLLRGIEQNSRPEKGLLTSLAPRTSEATSAEHRQAESGVQTSQDLKYMPQR